mmetsp:Transcript_111558/g.204641  ORF Transcript_111558/g.204641 Transcript_111558/m.204641 type:complete len:218 (+) Transcript_111558:1-654(+)
MLPDFNVDTDEVITEVACDASSPAGEDEQEAAADTSARGIASGACSTEGSARASEMPHGVDGGTGGMPQTGREAEPGDLQQASSSADASQVALTWLDTETVTATTASSGTRDASGSNRARRREEEFAGPPEATKRENEEQLAAGNENRTDVADVARASGVQAELAAAQMEARLHAPKKADASGEHEQRGGPRASGSSQRLLRTHSPKKGEPSGEDHR